MRLLGDSSDVTGSSTILFQTPHAQKPERTPDLVANVSKPGNPFLFPLPHARQKLLGHFCIFTNEGEVSRALPKEKGWKEEGEERRKGNRGGVGSSGHSAADQHNIESTIHAQRHKVKATPLRSRAPDRPQKCLAIVLLVQHWHRCQSQRFRSPTNEQRSRGMRRSG